MTIIIDKIDEQNKTLYATVDDTLTSNDIVDYFKAVDEALPHNAGFTEHIDFTKTQVFAASYNDRTHFESIARKVYEEKKYTRVICVVKTDEQFGSVRMYASLFHLTDILDIRRLD
jgi:hypothetical protein